MAEVVDINLRALCRELIGLIKQGAMVGNPDIDRDGAIDGEGDSVLAQIESIVGSPTPDEPTASG